MDHSQEPSGRCYALSSRHVPEGGRGGRPSGGPEVLSASAAEALRASGLGDRGVHQCDEAAGLGLPVRAGGQLRNGRGQ